MTLRIATIGFAFALAASSFALSLFQDHDTLTGLHDYGTTSGLAGNRFSAYAYRDFGDNPAYINAVQVSFGAGWDSNINLQTDYSLLDNSYTLGTALGEGDFVKLNFAGLFDLVDSSVATGMYGFSVDLFGGETGSDNNLLGSFDYILDVRETLNARVTASVTPGVVGVGQTATAFATLENQSDDSIFSGSWYLYIGVPFGGDLPNALDNMDWGFAGDWFGKEIGVGQSRTDMHSVFTPNAATAPGAYKVYGGLYFGYHDGDNYFQNFEEYPSFQAVPEPVSMIGLGSLGLLAFKKRRNR